MSKEYSVSHCLGLLQIVLKALRLDTTAINGWGWFRSDKNESLDPFLSCQRMYVPTNLNIENYNYPHGGA